MSSVHFAPAAATRLLVCLAVLLLVGAPVAFAQTKPSPAALAAYAAGLDALRDGNFPQATSEFARAMQNSDDPEFVLAHGVALVLSYQFKQALPDLKRAKQLGWRGREPELWTYAAESMGFFATRDHAPGGPLMLRDRDMADGMEVSVPGHMVQGRNGEYSTAYASTIVYDLAMPYGFNRRVGEPVDMNKVQAARLKAAAAFAELHGTRSDIAGSHIDRGRPALTQKNYSAALREYKLALTPDPGNGQLIANVANVYLSYGRPATARKEFTRALTRAPSVAAYLGRSLAAARMGDAKRADADLAVATSLDQAAAAKWRSAIKDSLSSRRVSGTPEAALAALRSAAAGNASAEQLATLARDVHFAGAPRRMHYDESYQDRIRQLLAAVRARPKDPAPATAYAAYLIAAANNKGERVEPRSEQIYFRWHLSREDDLAIAIRATQHALTLDARYAPAMIQQALAMTALRRYDDAEALADRALAISPNNAEALQLYARFRADRAANLADQAAGLRQDRCSSQSHTEDRSDGVYEVTHTTCVQPSQFELSQAQSLDAQADAMARRAQAAIDKALRVSAGTLEGDLIKAQVAMAARDTAAAEASLLHAIKLDPTSVIAQERLADVYAQSGRTDPAEMQLAMARRLVQTTAAPLLRLAWTRIQRTAWAGADEVLNRAERFDITEARVPAYRSIVRMGQGRAADAATELRVAIALEEARIRIDEPLTSPTPALARDPAEFAVAIEARLRLAALQSAAPATVFELMRANIAYESRIPEPLYATQMFGSMWPDAKPRGGAMVPAPINAATSIASSRLLAGRVLMSAGRNAEAQAQLQVAANLGHQRGTPRISTGRGDSNFSGLASGASGDAMIELARLNLQAGNNQKAFELMQTANENDPTPAGRAAMDRLMSTTIDRLNNR